MALLHAKDTISGQEGKAFFQTDNVTEEMFYIKSLEATVEKEKAEVKILGRRGTQHKASGWKGTGKMTIYYVTSKFRQMMFDYIKNGKDMYFTIEVTNEDPTSSIGRQVVTLNNVNLDSVMIAKLDTESDVLEEEVSFTFDDMDLKEHFKDPA